MPLLLQVLAGTSGFLLVNGIGVHESRLLRVLMSFAFFQHYFFG